MQAVRRQRCILGARRLAASLGLLSGTDQASLVRKTVPEHAAAARAISLSTRHRRAVVRELLVLARLRTGPPSLGSLIRQAPGP